MLLSLLPRRLLLLLSLLLRRLLLLLSLLPLYLLLRHDTGNLARCKITADDLLLYLAVALCER